MQATLPVRTFNATWLGLVALRLAATIVFGAALAFGISRGIPAAAEQPAAAQAIEQSVLNHVADERTNAVAAPAPVFVNPNADDKVGTRNQVDRPLLVDPDAAEAGARGRIVNLPQ
jgi:hypothetical protein